MEAEKKYKIGYVPGVFDLFHVGHLNLINRARAQSKYLMAGVLSDELVVHFKGKKPYIPFEERFAIVAAVKGVDEVVKVDFSNTVKMDAWKLYHYDAYFSGDDHGHEWDDEKKALQAVGSDIVFLPYTKSTSSTMIKGAIRGKEKGRLYLFGAGKIGQQTLREFRSDERSVEWEIAGFLDNSPEKHLTRVQGMPVYRPEDLKTLENGETFGVIFAAKNIEGMEEQMERLGVGFTKI
ncbi:MAG: adenylyltransferase/cytidyltransferase family protein [Clostridium sp.]|nr:adenylyltransferase/cytidyltransferase family protein [Clostridium sp.]